MRAATSTASPACSTRCSTGEAAVRRPEGRDGEDVGPGQRRAAPAARAAARRASGARGRGPARAGQGARRRVRRAAAFRTPTCSRPCGEPPLRAAAYEQAVEELRGQHDPAERHPGRAVVGRATAGRAPRPRRAARRGRPRCPAAAAAPAAATSATGCRVLPVGLPERSCSTGSLVGFWSVEDGPCPGGDLPPGRVRILGHPDERAHGVEAELRRPLRMARAAPIGTGLPPSSLAQSGGSRRLSPASARSVIERELAARLPQRPSPDAAPQRRERGGREVAGVDRDRRP